MSVTGNGLRIIGDESGPDYDCHRARYVFAKDILPAGSIVLDYGCGTGYGTKILVEKHHAIGYDPDEAAVAFGRERWGADLRSVLPTYTADAVVCFEVLEHLERPPCETVATLLGLAPLVVASVPFWEPLGNNPHHRWFGLHEESFSAVSTRHHVGFYYQDRGGVITASPSPAQNLIVVVRA